MKKWLLLAVVGLMSACSKSDIEEVNTSIGSESPTFYASLEGSDETRTYLDANQKMRWTADDRVTIFFGENYNREFAFTGETGSTAGSFNQKSTDGFYTAEKVTANYAVYPHQASTQLEVEGYFKFSLPATQSYAEDSFGLNANTMVAVTKTVDDRFLQFKNVCGYLKLNLYGANVTVKSITLTGNNEEPLAGAATVTPTYGGDPSMAWAASGTTTSLTLDCGDGVKIGATEAEATPFWLVVPPTTFTKGFTVTITDTAGNTFTKSSTSKQTITRNISKNMPAFEVKTAPTGPANNEIWYTSTDGKIVEPHSKDAFGVAIKSNTYENGKGVITFDGDVKRIGESAFEDCTSLASIIIPEGVTTIGACVFYRCTSLASITLPESVTTIGASAFYGCASIQSITIPAGVTLIEQVAFAECPNLASIMIPESVTEIGGMAFWHCSNLNRVDISDIAAWCKIGLTDDASNPMGYGASLYLNGTLVEDLIIPNEITEIKQFAFRGCTSLKSITIPKGLTTIGEGAFAGCTSLKNITVPEGVTSIGWNAFIGCESLASITLPEGITEIGQSAFYGCKSLKRVDISDIAAWCKINFAEYRSNPMSYGASLYLNSTLVEDLIIPDEITEMKQYAFTGCKSLKSITLPEGVTAIGEHAFNGCTSLAGITIPEGVTSIGFGTFWGCVSLRSITIPEKVTTIGKSAFEGCSSLPSINIPEGVTTIGGSAFEGCSNLTRIISNAKTAPQVSSDTFRNVASSGTLCRYYESDYSTWKELLPEGWVYQNIYPDYIKTGWGGDNISWLLNTHTGEMIFSGTGNMMNYSALFAGSWQSYGSEIKSITFEEGITSIGRNAFGDMILDRYRNLKEITIPSTIRTIYNLSFNSCPNISVINVASTAIPDGFRCDKVTCQVNAANIQVGQVYYEAGFKNINVPNTKGSCGATAMWELSMDGALSITGTGNIYDYDADENRPWSHLYTYINTIYVSEEITRIGNNVFCDCSSLASIYCKPTTPPAGGTDMFRNNAPGRKIYVPAGSVDAYKAAEDWKNYAYDIVAEE